MPRGKFKLMIQISPRLGSTKPPVAPPSPVSSSSSSSASSDSGDDNDSSSSTLEALEAEHESLTTMMEDLKKQMASIEIASTQINSQVETICKKAKEDDDVFDWEEEPLKPAKPAVEEWLSAHELPLKPTLRQFMGAVFDAAKSLDLATRIITLKKEDADVISAGQRRITVFELLGFLSELFE